MDKYRVIDYFDVWGNAEDGWEVNNLAKIGEIELEDYTSVEEVIGKLQDMDFLSGNATAEVFEVYNDYHFIEYYIKAENNKPMFRLELVEG